ISEAVEVAAKNADTNYSLGSVLGHVLLHQTVIGQEAIAQLELAGVQPDVVIGCVGGGSNFGGLAIPFLRRVIREGAGTRFNAAREAGEVRVILFGLCGHGHFDLSAYDAYLAGKLEDPEFSEADMEAALARLPEAPALA